MERQFGKGLFGRARPYRPEPRRNLWESLLKQAEDKEDQEVNKMEIKSRYEVISDLERKKRQLIIMERDGFDDKIKNRERDIRDLKRELEDKKDELKDFKESVEEKKETIKELIRIIDDSLERFSNLNQNKSRSRKKQ